MICDFTLVGGPPDEEQWRRTGVSLMGDRARARGISIRDTSFYGFDLRNWVGAQTVNCVAANPGDAGIAVRRTSTASPVADVLVAGCAVDRSGLNPADAINAGIEVASTGGAIAKRLRIADCDFAMPGPATAATGIRIEVYGAASEVSVTGNTTSGGTMGISLDWVSDAVVSDNTCRYAAGYGIELAGSSHCVVNANVVRGEGITANRIAASIQNPGNLEGFSVTRNHVNEVTQKGIGFFFAVAISSSDNVVSVLGASARALSLEGSTDLVVTGKRLVGDKTQPCYAIVLAMSPKGASQGNRATGFTVNFTKPTSNFVR